MLQWKTESDGRSALIIEGARRVGKTTLATEFAKNEYGGHILIDFSNCSKEVMSLFDDIFDLDFVFNRLQIIYKTTLVPRKSVIIFDEVQKCPHARQAIKHLVADGRFDYIETGSLISIRQNVKDIVIPSEEHRIYLRPMDYEEFLWAMEDDVSVPLLRNLFESRRGMGDDGNRTLMRRYRLYMLIGGMPQAVSTYVETKSLAMVDVVKRTIITLYENDFTRIDSTGNAAKMFHAIPAALNSNSSRYMVRTATDGGRANRMEETIAQMEDSMTVNIAYHANDPSVGIALHRDSYRHKMFVSDTGLFVTLAFWDKKFTENIIYEKLLSDKLETDLGYVYENMVAQTLKAAGHELYYYTFPTEKGGHNYEIDFLIAERNKISPIEVKSSGYNRHKSLDIFCQKFSSRIQNKYLICTKDLSKDADVVRIPMYMAMFL